MESPTFAKLEDITATGVKLTPMMEQYFEIKKNYPDILLFFRMGDFYELFFEDAVEAGKILNITVTHRGKIGEVKIPMAGIPHHAAHNYIDRITSRGFKVAICEQTEDPKQAKGIVKRAVTQVVSPGIPFNLDRGDHTVNRYIASAIQSENQCFYLSIIDFATGEFFGEKVDTEQDLIEKISILKPEEFICFLGQWDRLKRFTQYLDQGSILKTHLSQEYFNPKYTDHYIEKIIPNFKADKTLKATEEIFCSIGALSYYVCSTQSLDKLSHFKPFRFINRNKLMRVTNSTLIGLEILPKNIQEKKHSLLGFVDKTQTAMGARALKYLFQNPYQEKKLLEKKLNHIEFLVNHNELINQSRSELSHIRDLERIMAKAITGKITPGDLLNLSLALDKLKILQRMFKDRKELLELKLNDKEQSALFKLKDFIDQAISCEVGANLDKGNLIKEGFNKKRDQLANMSFRVAKSLLELEEKYRNKTGINTLKIKSNNVAGYFIEVSKTQSDKASKYFDRKQTLKNAERYQSAELKAFEQEIYLAKDKLYHLEKEIFNQIVDDLINQFSVIQNLSRKIAEFDIYQSLAWVAMQYDFTKPEILENRREIEIQQAWHPLIKETLKGDFVHHDLSLNEKKFFGLITGPNMAGKTTVMREIAIVQFLTQIGSFVPAKKAKLGLKDYLFSRLGAHDDITRGQSTFMVEMSETAEIIHHATENSLIILDELGRGTSTYDGMSIAWALVEYFVDQTKALTLFSTHYHELIELVQSIPQAKNLTVKTINHKGSVKFLYELIEEGAKQSFGIHVAKMAGLPDSVIKRATHLLKTIEKSHLTQDDVNQVDLFKNNTTQDSDHLNNELTSEIKQIDLSKTTPLELMNKIHQLQENL